MFKSIWQWIRIAFKVITTIKKNEALIKPIVEEAKRDIEALGPKTDQPLAGKDSEPEQPAHKDQ